MTATCQRERGWKQREVRRTPNAYNDCCQAKQEHILPYLFSSTAKPTGLSGPCWWSYYVIFGVALFFVSLQPWVSVHHRAQTRSVPSQPKALVIRSCCAVEGRCAQNYEYMEDRAAALD